MNGLFAGATTFDWVLMTTAALLLLCMPLWVRLGIWIHHAANKPVTWQQRVQSRFARQSTFAWMFAWFKVRMDPMFEELPRFFQEHRQPIASVLDIGCGYGITGAGLLEWLPGVKVRGLDPCSPRARCAAAVFGDRGSASVGGAPDILRQGDEASYDLVLFLDVIHFLDDAAVMLTFERVKQALTAGGRFYLRATVLGDGPRSLVWGFDVRRRKYLKIPTHHRTREEIRQLLERAGLAIQYTGSSGTNRELEWFISERATTPGLPGQ